MKKKKSDDRPERADHLELQCGQATPLRSQDSPSNGAVSTQERPVAPLAGRVWETLSKIDVNDRVEKKGRFSYLSWAWAWGEMMKRFPDTSYVVTDQSYSDGTVMIMCDMTVREGPELVSRNMWLPVMDNNNKAIKNPTTRHINDNRMRCLVKCLAMFGLGHYIYAGEDIPDDSWEPSADHNKSEDSLRAERKQALAEGAQERNWDTLNKGLLEAKQYFESNGVDVFDYVDSEMVRSKDFAVRAAALSTLQNVIQHWEEVDHKYDDGSEHKVSANRH